MDIVVGTYEQLLLGYRLVKDDSNLKEYKFVQLFTDHSHDGCIKAIAISKKGVLVSGGTDEMIQMLNLKKRVEMGSLVHHEGAITDLSFFRSSHLFSVSEDATLCIWKYYTWECLRTLRGHKHAINSLAVHPSGKLALTVSKDNTLRTWNLITGRPAYITNTSQPGEKVLWSIKGSYYAILYTKSIDVYKTSTAVICCHLESNVTINTMSFCKDEILLYCEEGGLVKFHDIKSLKSIHDLQNGTKRVKSVFSTSCPDNLSVTWILTASSEGSIKVWQLRFEDSPLSSSLVAEIQTGFRIICMAAITQTPTPREKKTERQTEEECVESSGSSESESEMSDSEIVTVSKTTVTRSDKLDSGNKVMQKSRRKLKDEVKRDKTKTGIRKRRFPVSNQTIGDSSKKKKIADKISMKRSKEKMKLK